MGSRLLIVDDENTLAESLRLLLSREGYHAETAGSAEAALSRLDEEIYDLVITDIVLPSMDGIELLEKVRARNPEQAMMVMTAHPTLDSAVRALRAGAFDYLIKPVMHEELKRTVRNALQVGALQVENTVLRRQVEERWDNEQIVGRSPVMRAIRAEVSKVSGSRSNILLLGETGTGKELFARAIHACSPRCDQPFVPINCGAIPENLLESELFGYTRGAFTGAVSSKRGLLEEADGGTVFLDEIGEMSHHLQSKLLRVIDDRQVRPLGALQARLVDIRFVAATNLDIGRAVEGGTFRADLYYRLGVISLTLPPLRLREGDVALLAHHFLGRLSHELGRQVREFEPEALHLLEAYPWPGNVRELMNVIERAVLLADGTTVRKEHLPIILRSSPEPPALSGESRSPGNAAAEVLSIEDYTREVIRLRQGNASEQEIAAILGVARKTLWEMRKRWGLPRP